MQRHDEHARPLLRGVLGRDDLDGVGAQQPTGQRREPVLGVHRRAEDALQPHGQAGHGVPGVPPRRRGVDDPDVLQLPDAVDEGAQVTRIGDHDDQVVERDAVDVVDHVDGLDVGAAQADHARELGEGSGTVGDGAAQHDLHAAEDTGRAFPPDHRAERLPLVDGLEPARYKGKRCT